MGEFVHVAPAVDLAPGAVKVIAAGGRSIAVFFYNGTPTNYEHAWMATPCPI